MSQRNAALNSKKMQSPLPPMVRIPPSTDHTLYRPLPWHTRLKKCSLHRANSRIGDFDSSGQSFPMIALKVCKKQPASQPASQPTNQRSIQQSNNPTLLCSGSLSCINSKVPQFETESSSDWLFGTHIHTRTHALSLSLPPPHPPTWRPGWPPCSTPSPAAL